MKKIISIGVSFFALAAATGASAEDYPGQNETKKKTVVCDPYVNYKCLDDYLGDNFFSRFINYYRLEWGHDSAPADPSAPASRRSYWPTTPQTTPPYPFTEWPYGGTQNLGVTRPNSIDSPLMVALSNTTVGQIMSDAHLQVYGWVNAGCNISTNGTRPGGNFPISYAYTPNTCTNDQNVVYFERVPDTVQTDHVDWGFRLSALWGENYRYTFSYGVLSYQLNNHNLVNGFDFPMEYAEMFFPQLAEGLLVRIGRYISVPDIEAQLAPNNYMYTHSLTYAWDNYTNEGVQTTTALTKNWFLQLGVSVGTEAAPWHMFQVGPNPDPNPLYPASLMYKDPGAMPSYTIGVRWQSDNGYDNVYVVTDAANNGNWGYNNLQWNGITWYHKFDEKWHFSWEAYWIHENRVLNLLGPLAGLASTPGATPWSSLPFNAPGAGYCFKDQNAGWCNTNSYSTVMYLGYKIGPLDDITFRPEWFNDAQGQRTGVATRIYDFGIGWQHWFSPQIEIRPEVDYFHSIDAPAFNGNTESNNLMGVDGASGPGCPGTSHFAGSAFGICPNKNSTWIAAVDAIIHF
jgi:hypothetical protein